MTATAFKQYPDYISTLMKDFAQAAKSFPETDITRIAKELIDGATFLDRQKAADLPVHAKYKNIIRDTADPPSCTTEEVALASWADPFNFPLSKGERWNEGRRATTTGAKYEVAYGRQYDFTPEEFAALPDDTKEAGAINPYMNTGMKGRGILGQEGPNHAVDNGIIVIKPDEHGDESFYILGILRKYDNNAPAFSGGFAKYSRDSEGGYIFDKSAVFESQMEELFEEMISGSVELQPDYRNKLPLLLAKEVQNRALSVQNPRFRHKLLEEDEIMHLQTEIETGLKLQQVRDKDPGFIDRLRQVVSGGHECFVGPVLNDPRNTNNSWIESRLSWFLLNEKTWNFIKGEKPVFDYEFSAGDDASGIVFHKLSPETVQSAYASHGPMMCFMAASFMLDKQANHQPIDPSVLKQINNVAMSLPKGSPS